RRRRVQAEQRPAMTGRQLAGLELRQHRRRQLQQANAVCHSRTCFAYARGDVLLRELELVAQTLERASLLDRVEVLALQVLNQRQLQRLAVVSIADPDRNSF